MPSIKSPVSWPGGKGRVVEQIIPLIPKHHTYCEPFGGGAALLLAKPRSKAEVYNDINSDVVRFFRVLRYHRQALLDELELIPNSRAELKFFLEQPGFTDIQRAARWYFRNKVSFSGLGEHFGTGKRGGGASHGSRANRLEHLLEVNKRLDRVCIEDRPALECIAAYDTPETFFFVDPPYVRGYDYNCPMKEADHTALRDALVSAAGRWIVTYDDHPLIRDLYADFEIRTFDTPMGINNRATKKTAALKQVMILRI